MSAFLGPIHYWLYNKIQLQEELIRKIAEYGEKSGWAVFSEKHLEEKTVNKELRPLNELIDVMNIHGWLQERRRPEKQKNRRIYQVYFFTSSCANCCICNTTIFLYLLYYSS